MNHNDETVHRYWWFDTRLSAYKGFYYHDWGKQLLALTVNTSFDEQACDLCLAWKSTSHVFMMPWLTLSILEQFVIGYSSVDKPFYERLTAEFRNYVLRHAGTALSPPQKTLIANILTDLGQKVEVSKRQAAPPFDIQEAWSTFISNVDFASGLWGLQRICYVSVYHGYEDFLQRCVATATKDPDYCARRSEQLRKTLNKTFGNALGDACLADKDVHTARLVRNALVHNGGRTDPIIDARKHQLRIVDNIIQIGPDDVRGLFELLKDKVTQLIKQALDMPDMHR